MIATQSPRLSPIALGVPHGGLGWLFSVCSADYRQHNLNRGPFTQAAVDFQSTIDAFDNRLDDIQS